MMLTDYKTYVLSKKQSLLYYILSGLLLLFLGHLFYQSPFVTVFFPLLSLPLRHSYERYLAKRRREVLTDQFRDLLYSLSASMGAGRQMPEALKEAEEGLLLIYQKDAYICTELAHMVRQMKDSQETADALLSDFGKRSGIADIRQFAQVYDICKTTGANLPKVIERTAATLIDKMHMKRELSVLVAQKKLEANILTAMPIGIIFFLNLIAPDYLEILYHCFSGRVVMSVALFLIAGAYAFSLVLTHIEME